MDFNLSEEDLELKETARELAEEEKRVLQHMIGGSIDPRARSLAASRTADPRPVYGSGPRRVSRGIG